MNIVDQFNARVREAPAVVTPEGTLSFAELGRAVKWTAASFNKAGLAAEDVVGIHLSDSVQYIVSALALARLGVGHLAIHDSDPPARRREVVRQSNVVATISNENRDGVTGTPLIEPPPQCLAEIKRLRASETEIVRRPNLPFMVIPTSGTTSTPRLLLLTHKIFRKRLDTYTYRLPSGPSSTTYSLTHIAFAGARQRALAQLMLGGCLAFMDDVADLGDCVDFIGAHGVNYVAGVPRHMTGLLAIARNRGVLLPGVAALQLSTTLVPEPLREQVRERLTPNLFIRYGINEAGTVSCATPAELASGPPRSVGTPASGVEIKVVDDRGNPLPRGQAGELRVRTSGLVDGYLGDPEATARSFRNGWFHTGDYVEFTPDGSLIHHGRADDMIIYDGVNIFPTEIENILLRLPAVAEAAALSVDIPKLGAVPVAAVVLNSSVTDQALLSHCKSWLGPRAPVTIRQVKELPRNAVGKVLKKDLESRFRVWLSSHIDGRANLGRVR